MAQEDPSYLNGSSIQPATEIHSVISSTVIVPSSTHILDLTTNVTGSTNATTEHAKDAGLSSHSAAIVVFAGVMGVAVLIFILFIYLRRRRKLSYLPFPCDKSCMQGRKRRSSTSSFNNPLTATDDGDLVISRDRELFSIGDQDGGNDGRIRPRARVAPEDDYFYDEIFERSAFVDERTNTSNKQLTVEDFDDFDIPDLTFKPTTTFKLA